MTYGENKKIFMALCDEFAPNNTFFTDDEDIQEKCALLYAPAYEELSSYRTKPKLKEVTVQKYTGDKAGFERINMPDCKRIKSIACLDANNNEANGNYKVLGSYLYLSNAEEYTYFIEYIPFLETITEETPDLFELELDQDLAMILPYIVASDLFKTDPGQDYTPFEQVLQRKLQMLNSNKMGMSANFSEGVFD